VLKFSDGRPDDLIDIIINIIIDFDMIVLWSSQEFGQSSAELFHSHLI